jgi:uncharacterized protein YbaP (TraB family)
MKRITILALCLCLLLVLAGCNDTPAPTTVPTTVPPTTTEPAPDAAAIYGDAVALLNAASDITLRITTKQTMTVAGEHYSDIANQTIRYDGYGTETMTATAEDHSTYASYAATYNEVFAEGKIYVTAENSIKESSEPALFTGEMTAEDFTKRYVPPQLLDAGLYADITIDGKTITFSAATAAESWYSGEYTQLKEASGTALLNDAGQIIRYNYEASYTEGPAEFEVEVQVFVDTDTDVPAATVPEGEFTAVQYPDAARFVDFAMGRLYQNGRISTTYSEVIVSQAAGFAQTTSTDCHLFGPKSDFKGMLSSDVVVMTQKGNETYTFEHLYNDGVYTFTQDDEEPQVSNTLSAQDFILFMVEYLYKSNLDPAMISEAGSTNLGGIYYLDLKLTEEFADRICRYLNNELWGDEEFLTGLASAYETTTNEAYLAIDGTTGFPTAIGVNYAGEHTIEGQAYVLSMQTDQTYELASQSAYKAITDENPPTEEPENKATPLFYHVTGADGQEMWLFGTIHVGDVRTAYLPKEIYDAFDAADSLAVEFDSDKFYEQMENDKDLQKLASDAYYYSDGTTTKDHIEDEEVYDYAEKLMKATGNFNMNALVMKPSIWGNSIENFYLKMGYRLHSGYGMDNLLMERAREQEKPIVDVESGIEQMQMLGGYSDALQEYLLCSTLSTAALEYQTEVQELFELWCSGDEAKMIAYLNEEDEEPDTSTMTQEELDEYNRVQELMDEYNSAMSSDRNVEMLKAAIDYLESDKVVFYAVGLAHLLAEDGLVNTLRDAGYTVELVTYS